MNRDTIIFNSLIKLANADKRLITEIIRDVERIYQKHKKTDFNDDTLPKDIVRYMQDILKETRLDQRDKLLILKEFKKKNMFNFNKNKNLEKAWRLIVRRWGIPSYRFEGNI
jgi:hypothetical protein